MRLSGARICPGFAHQLLGERITDLASLAFTTILALVPLLAVSFAILRFRSSGDVADAIRTWMLTRFKRCVWCRTRSAVLEETKRSAQPCWVVFSGVASLALFVR